ncbi:MAG: thioredoxin family protein [Bacteroidales bacterium]|nr:thioredoxin family protein [Bacteroidales bacterium]
MKTKLILLLAIPFLFFQFTPIETDDPLPASKILKTAKKQARKEGKNVFIMWHASWCGWCHRMDKQMNDPEVKEFFDANYVIIHLVAKESKDNKHLENPGSDEMLAKYKGDKSGIPFWVILDKKGDLLADSFMRTVGEDMEPKLTNSGCPGHRNEVDHFIKVLKETSEMKDEDLAKIDKLFFITK